MARTNKKGSADETRVSGEADRRFILELLEGAKERQEEAYPGTDSAPFLYFAHLSAARQLTEIYYRRLLKPHRISYSEYRVLSSLRVRGRGFGTTPIELNRFAQITSAGMTRTLDRLEEAGYIERSPNPEDRRSILISLTRAGWDFADALGEDLNAQYADALEDLSAEELKTEIGQLRVIVERLAQAVIG